MRAPKQKHFPHLNVKEIPALSTEIKRYFGSRITRITTKLLMITGLRTTEWADIDFDKGIWPIPAERMKIRRPHIVPISRQARELLEELHQLIGRRRYGFHGRNDAGKPMKAK
ncbi:tyrosine-type recombinase/integrase [Rosenbergiella australiborealis]|uniref:tyrosine-type recombinase/integrase n=1 Tax=Rosenbergiella australiborealis TaxID=1544696 RepID=UPI001F4DAD67|nr:tyrosine-type recombinase/integrase [Rosenbergiella australiborealis]